jgi:flavin-dependent dehydrogenase
MRESEQLLVPLEEVFDPKSVENLKGHGVKGVVPIELPIEELMVIAESRVYEVDGFSLEMNPHLDIGFYWVFPKEEGETAVVFYTKKTPDGEAVYIADDNFERFKELFLS